MWFKYRHKFSHGPDEWQFTEADDKEELKSRMDGHDGEHYRGIEFMPVKGLPEIIISEKMKHILMKQESLKREAEALLKVKPLKVVPKCSRCGWKYYCQEHPSGKKLKLKSPECVKEFIGHEDPKK